LHKIAAISLLILGFLFKAGAQGLINNGGNIVMKTNTYLIVKGANGHFLNKNNGLVDMRGAALMKVGGNWTNEAANPVMKSNGGTVELNGGIQTIGGFYPTGFSGLILGGTGEKRLLVNTYTGGVYGGTKSGVLVLHNRLVLNSKRLIVNNGRPSAIHRTTGYILSETDPITGYGEVQWNLRSSNNDSLYILPFGANDAQFIPLVLGVKQAGTQTTDSGYLVVATYPTNPNLLTNNRPLPTGVNNFMNRFGLENANMALDRFWVIQGGEFTQYPEMDVVFSYRDQEWDAVGASKNDIEEPEMVAVKYNQGTQKWEYPGFGFNDPTLNRVYTSGLTSYLGNWVLTELPYCPVADYTTDDRCYTIPFIFKDSSSINKFNITKWEWDFGDGNISVDKNPVHTYQKPGLYPVQLKVTASQGCPDSVVYMIEAFTHPDASFVHADTCFDQQTLLKSTSVDTGYTITGAFWKTSDGANLNGDSTRHQFGSVGSQFASLIVENEKGCRDTVINTLTIRPNPRATFITQPICENSNVDYFSTSSTASGAISKYYWKLPFGYEALRKDTSFFFQKPGSYSIRHRVINNFGCIDSTDVIQLVKPKVYADFDFSPDVPTIADPKVFFTEKTINANSWFWDLGEPGEFSNMRNPIHDYKDTGWFRVILIANNDVNCPDTAEKQVYIKPVVKIWIPNAFSPQGGDILNNTFRPLGTLSGITDYNMVIFNRWGEKLYETTELEKPWDGTIQNGNTLCQTGVYMYMIRMIDINRETHTFHGAVHLIR
jgi:gliding motility-associated-like protein